MKAISLERVLSEIAIKIFLEIQCELPKLSFRALRQYIFIDLISSTLFTQFFSTECVTIHQHFDKLTIFHVNLISFKFKLF